MSLNEKQHPTYLSTVLHQKFYCFLNSVSSFSFLYVFQLITLRGEPMRQSMCFIKNYFLVWDCKIAIHSSFKRSMIKGYHG
jgi:hypothetical protein